MRFFKLTLTLGAALLICAVIGVFMLWRESGPGGEAERVPTLITPDPLEPLVTNSQRAKEPTTELARRALEIDALRSESGQSLEPNSAWFVSRGFTTEYNIHFLNTEFLESQARAGDMLAAQMLGYQKMGTDEGNKLLLDAARWGSIQALYFLSYSHEVVASGRLKEQQVNVESKQDQYEYGIRALEYLLLAELRGDTLSASSSIERLAERLTYTADDIELACSMALNSYDSLNAARMAEGLAEFDNSPPRSSGGSTKFGVWCTQEDND